MARQGIYVDQPSFDVWTVMIITTTVLTVLAVAIIWLEYSALKG